MLRCALDWRDPLAQAFQGSAYLPRSGIQLKSTGAAIPDVATDTHNAERECSALQRASEQAAVGGCTDGFADGTFAGEQRDYRAAEACVPAAAGSIDEAGLTGASSAAGEAAAECSAGEQFHFDELADVAEAGRGVVALS